MKEILYYKKTMKRIDSDNTMNVWLMDKGKDWKYVEFDVKR
jgi:hypothetical protein